ncbi:unnamed protein product [Spirodela intermedia]|uniref:Photosystem II protein T n=1 Tax=Spirodela intermedia TaxID=51605 RepID=A0ABN7EB46_SPIIN|nr:unnamed protein product [Spirodela intermedia]
MLPITLTYEILLITFISFFIFNKSSSDNLK